MVPRVMLGVALMVIFPERHGYAPLAGLAPLLGYAAILLAIGARADGATVFHPESSVLDLAQDLSPGVRRAPETALDERRSDLCLASSALREHGRRALLVRALHVLGDSAALIVDDAIRQGRSPLPPLLMAALEAR